MFEETDLQISQPTATTTSQYYFTAYCSMYYHCPVSTGSTGAHLCC